MCDCEWGVSVQQRASATDSVACCSGALPLGEDLQQLPGYVWAAAVSVCQLPAVPLERQAAAERLLLLLSEQYARVAPRHRFLAHAALAQALHQLLARSELAQACIDTLGERGRTCL